MKLALGLDTGGTYTDAVVMDFDAGEVVSSAKALTTRHDLSVGIAEAIRSVLGMTSDNPLPFSAKQIALVAVSTTLATNALAEGHRARVSLILIGYDPRLMAKYGFDRELSTDDIVHVQGGHDLFGDEVAPLDEAAIRAAVLTRRDKVEAFAVSGYFGVRNPEHEIRARALIHQLTDLPVTCGHELTSQLNAVRRATTTALNAHLILPLTELISSVQHTLQSVGISAPLMVVKGDGSLVRAEWAALRPIETILSGPAASIVGARYLAGREDVWVVDVGGTTTDIGVLRAGAPLLCERGASVAGWRTMVEAIDVHTVGLGGDSHVRLQREHDIAVGPRRVVPLCLLAARYPAVTQQLLRQASTLPERLPEEAGEFLMPGRPAANSAAGIEADILERLSLGPQPLDTLVSESRFRGLLRHAVENLESLGLVRRAAFTPTDALHALGRFRRWDAEAAQAGATILAARAGLSAEGLCERIIDSVADRIALELVTKVLSDEVGPLTWDREPAGRSLVRRAFDAQDDGDLQCHLTLRRPLVAIGAPVSAYMPGVAKRLKAEVIIPPHADVANAIGAVTGSVVQRAQAQVGPSDEGDTIRLYLPEGVEDFGTVEDAIAHAEKVMSAYVRQLASQAGGEEVQTHMARRDYWIPVQGTAAGSVYMGSELTFSAVGRPSPARHGTG
jgi:N-methylhydantoinase A/oxoprolinase/acetone carboxylase beta subunit